MVIYRLKTEIFNEGLKRALNKDYVEEMKGFEDKNGHIALRSVMHNMIRIEVQDIIYDQYFKDKPDEEYDKWCDGPCQDMYHDLWCWIDNMCPFAFDDADCIDLFKFSDTNWNIIKEE